MGFSRKFDPYLRRKISGKLQKDGSIDFISTYSYPTEGILFAFDRENIKIKFNDKFDEEYYLDETTPQKVWFIKEIYLMDLEIYNNKILPKILVEADKI